MLNQILLGDAKCQKFFCSSSHGLLGTAATASQFNGQWFKLPPGGASRYWISTANAFASYGGYTAICKRLLRTDVPPVPLSEVGYYLTSVLQKAEFTCTESFRDNELKDLLQALFVRCIHSMETDSLTNLACPPISVTHRMVSAADSVLKACAKRYGEWSKTKRRMYIQWKLMLQLAMLRHGSLVVAEAAMRDLRAACSATSSDVATQHICLQWLDSQSIVARMLNSLQRLCGPEGGPPSLSGGAGAVDTGSTDDDSEVQSDDEDDVPPTVSEDAASVSSSEAFLADVAAGTSALSSSAGHSTLRIALLDDDKSWLRDAVLKAGTEIQMLPDMCLQQYEFLCSVLDSREVAALKQHTSVLPGCLAAAAQLPAAQRMRLSYVPPDDLDADFVPIVGAVTDTLADLIQANLLEQRQLEQLAAAHRTCSSTAMHNILAAIRSELEVELEPRIGKHLSRAVSTAVRLGARLPDAVAAGILRCTAHTSEHAEGANSPTIQHALHDLSVQMASLHDKLSSLAPVAAGPAAAARSGGAAAPAVGLTSDGHTAQVASQIAPSPAMGSVPVIAPPAPGSASDAASQVTAEGSWLILASKQLNLNAQQQQSLADFAAFLAQQPSTLG